MSFPAIQSTLIIITDIEGKIFHRDLRQRLKLLLKSVQDSIKEIETYLRTPQYFCYKNKIKLCISQMLKVIPALIHLLSDGKHTAFEDIAEYMLKKLRWCLMEPMRMFNGGGIEEDTETSGIFVNSIDWAISLLQIGEPVNEAYKLAIDDLLCQALTIAKLASEQDYNEITSGCRSVLVSLNSVLDIKENVESARRLHRDILLCNLETLYRRVNTAVLRLFLYVMSDSFLPLKNIVIKCVERCSNDGVQKKRNPRDLDQLISQLDLYLEQIHLLGNFAVACTDNWEKKLNVQSCLASLEFCETYLVPTLTSFYVEPQSKTRDFLSFLTDEAQKSLKDLHLHIDNIVDTGSFARVVFEDLSDLIRIIRENVSDGLLGRKECELFQRRCNKLIQHLLTTDDKYVRQETTIQQIVKQLLTVLKKQHDNLQICSPTINHIVWDLDLGLELLDHLCQKLNFSALNHSTVGRISIDRSVTNPGSVKNLPMAISTPRCDRINFSQETSRNCKFTPYNNNKQTGEDIAGAVTDSISSTLEPYLSRVGESPMIKSTLYCRTPLRTPRKLKLDSSKTTYYDFNDILEEISNLSETSEINLDKHKVIQETSSCKTNYGKNSLTSVTVINQTESSDIFRFDTRDRLRDLLYLEDKINHLKNINI